MASTSIPLSIPFLGSKSAVIATPPPPTSVRFRPKPLVSAAYTTAERTRSNSRISTPASLYDVLGIQMGATCQEIKSAYRRLARVLHPDVASSSSDGRKDASADEFIRIHAAYATLSDPEKRADYDRTVFVRRQLESSTFGMSAVMTSASTSGFSGCRNWETDQCW